MTRSKVKVTRPLKLKILRFSAIFNGSWQITTDSETTEQYLTFVRSRFLIYVLVFCHLTSNLKRRDIDREVSDFGNFSTDTGSTLAEESIAIPYGANFILIAVCNVKC